MKTKQKTHSAPKPLKGETHFSNLLVLLLLLLSRFSRVQLCATPQTAAHQAPPSLGFSRREYWSGLPFPSPVRESEKWKWTRSVVSDSLQLHGLQPTRLLRPWDFPGKSTGVGCHCLLQCREKRKKWLLSTCSVNAFLFENQWQHDFRSSEEHTVCPLVF